MKQIYFLIGVLLIGGCTAKKQPPMPTPDLRVAVAQERMVPNIEKFITQTKAARSYIIQPRVNGYLNSINYSSGKPVKRGQVIFTIDPAPFLTQVAEARASLASAKASLVQAQADYNRSAPLARINAISQSQLDAAIATLAAARQQVESAQAVLDNAKLNLGYCTIKAPESGIIASSTANAGDYVGAGTAYQNLTTISFDDSVSVNLSLPTVKYYNLVPQDRPMYKGDSLLHDITLELSDGAIYPYKGIYRYTQPLVDDQTGSVVFSVRFPNPEGQLKGGQFARVTASVGTPMMRVLIPSRSVNEIQGVYSTYVVNKGDSLEFRKLTLGDVVGSEWIVLDGVKAGETVITEGFEKAKSGMKIKPIKQAQR